MLWSMPSFLDQLADDVFPPTDAAAAATSNLGRAGVFRVALTSASVAVNIPAFWRGRFADFQCEGGTGLWLLFGTDAGAVIVTPTTTVSTVASNVITFVTGTPWKIAADTIRSYRIPEDPTITRFAFYGVSASGFIAAHLSSGQGGAPTTLI